MSGGVQVGFLLMAQLFALAVPLVLAALLLWLAFRAVRALESIAESLRQNR